MMKKKPAIRRAESISEETWRRRLHYSKLFGALQHTAARNRVILLSVAMIQHTYAAPIHSFLSPDAFTTSRALPIPGIQDARLRPQGKAREIHQLIARCAPPLRP